MIIVKLIGGLGNQMFQYAAGRRIAFINNTELKLDISGFEKLEGVTPRKYELKHFNIMENIALEREIKKFKSSNRFYKLFFRIKNMFKPYYRRTIIKERFFHFDPDILKIGNNVYLEGYWQSEKYFKDIEEIIRKEFTVRYPISGKNKEIMDIIKDKNSVSMHFRRGDYVKNPDVNKLHGICTYDYYNKSIEYFAGKIKEPYFFIFTDDSLFIKENFKPSYPVTFIEHNGEEYVYEDLRLMSYCKHNIIANSSFSWWGGWLNKNPDKIVIAPEKWFNSAKYNTQDLISPDWILI